MPNTKRERNDDFQKENKVIKMDVSDEDKDGFINLNVRVHRDDIFDVIGDDFAYKATVQQKKRRISKELFKRIAQRMADNEPFSGGDMFSDSCLEAYDAETKGD